MRTFALLLLVLTACGSDGGGDAIESGTITGSYNGTSFTPAYGFATVYHDSP